MFSARQAARLNLKSSPELPKVDELSVLYDWGLKVRQGSLTMIAGRPGSQKSGFALFWARQMGLPTLYFNADMSAFEATSRLVGMELGLDQDTVEQLDPDAFERALADSNIYMSFDNPLSFGGLEDELEAYVEIFNAYPKLIIIDNLCDWEGAEFDYGAQMQVMADLTGLLRETGMTCFLLHHTSDGDPRPEQLPQDRGSIKNKLGEKPNQTLTVALDPTTHAFRVAVVKQRNGRQKKDGSSFAVLRAYPEVTRFESLGYHNKQEEMVWLGA